MKTFYECTAGPCVSIHTPLPCHVWPWMHTTIVLRNFHFVAEYFLVLYSLDFADRFLSMYQCCKKFISLQKLYIVKGWQRLLY